jgi:hypothetical protein
VRGFGFLFSFECEANNWPALNANDVEGMEGLAAAVSCSGNLAKIVDVHMCKSFTLSSATPEYSINAAAAIFCDVAQSQ